MEYIPAKTILSRNKSTGWFGTDHTINLYRGCCHGCIYCDSRSSCYGIEEFDRVRAKEDALRILRDELRRKVKPGFIGMGSMSDPYNPFEEKELLTRHALELADAFDFGVGVATKSDLIVRDTDLYKSIQTHSPVVCKITVTTVDENLAAKIEPRAPSPARRLAAVKALSDAGIMTGVLLMPVLPFLEDKPEQVLAVVEAAARAGARFVYPGIGVTMRDSQREYLYGQLERLFPGEYLAEQYRKKYGQRYSCAAPRAAELWKLVEKRCGELGMLCHMRGITAMVKRGYGDMQLSFFP